MTFLTTIIATLFGGILAVGTSVFLRQWELRQTTRIRMYDELLPQLAREYFGWRDMHQDVLTVEVSKEIFDSVTRLYRAAKISGHGETVIVAPIKGYMRDRSRTSDLEQAHAIDDQINEQFSELENYLEKKIR